ncbi:MAG: biotin/lipoate A/B protein ligase family protein [Thermodesulfovibrionia bacterium]|nr:biotin/lipoate A/B protein ligase family protein [Thermodesulfovibrionia bacterium]
MNFTRIIIQEENNAFYNMALDEAICEAVRNDLSPPTLRIYKWERPTLSLGYFQKISDIDMDYCRSNNYPVVRRLTGGRAILHESELTYSFSAKKGSLLFNGELHNDYTVISNALVEGLKLCGVDAEISFTRKRATDQKSPACFKVVSYGEVTVDNKKVIGSAQKRYKDGFLQHGSLLLDFNEAELQNVLKCSSKDDFSGIGSINGYADKTSYIELVRGMKKAFAKVLDTKMITDEPTGYELKAGKELESKKYSSDEWNAMR